MKANRIISVRTVSGKSLNKLLSAVDQFSVSHVIKCGGVWSVSYV